MDLSAPRLSRQLKLSTYRSSGVTSSGALTNTALLFALTQTLNALLFISGESLPWHKTSQNHVGYWNTGVNATADRQFHAEAEVRSGTRSVMRSGSMKAGTGAADRDCCQCELGEIAGVSDVNHRPGSVNANRRLRLKCTGDQAVWQCGHIGSNSSSTAAVSREVRERLE